MTNRGRITMDHPPMVEAYLADLERALSDSNTRERAETMAAVREHLADALPADATPEQIRHVLDRLGPVETIAANATPAHTPARSTTAPERAGVALGALVSALMGAILLVPLPFVGLLLVLLALVAGIVHLRTGRRGRPLAWAAVVIATLTLLAALVGGLTLLSADTHQAPRPGPVRTAQ